MNVLRCHRPSSGKSGSGWRDGRKKKRKRNRKRKSGKQAGAEWAAWHLPSGPVGPASRWAATSNVEVDQTICPFNSGTVGMEGTSGADSIGHGGHVPHFYIWLDTGGTVSRRTANKKLTKMC